MEKKYEQLKADVLDEIEAIEQVLKDLSFLKNTLDSDKIDNVQKAAIGTFLKERKGVKSLLLTLE